MKPVQARLYEYERGGTADLSKLSEAQREVFEAVEIEGYGVREFARKSARSPGTVGNLLRRARRRLDDDGGAE